MATPEEQKLDLHFKEDLSAIFSLSFLYGPEGIPKILFLSKQIV